MATTMTDSYQLATDEDRASMNLRPYWEEHIEWKFPHNLQDPVTAMTDALDHIEIKLSGEEDLPTALIVTGKH